MLRNLLLAGLPLVLNGRWLAAIRLALSPRLQLRMRLRAVRRRIVVGLR